MVLCWSKFELDGAIVFFKFDIKGTRLGVGLTTKGTGEEGIGPKYQIADQGRQDAYSAPHNHIFFVMAL